MNSLFFKKFLIKRRRRRQSPRKSQRKSRRKSLNRKPFVANKENARLLVHERIKHFNAHYGFKIGRISVRNQRSRWGSCSKLGNLNFNYRIVFLSPNLADYIIVHELCHIGQFNHSKKFWNLVFETIPNYPRLRLELKKIKIR